MAGILPNEGESFIADYVLNKISTDRGTNLQLGLFTNSGPSISDSTTYSSLTQPTGGGYAVKTLTDGSWTTISGTSTYPVQTFVATGSAFTGSIVGYFVATTGASPKILAIEVDPLGPYTLLTGDSYAINLSISVS